MSDEAYEVKQSWHVSRSQIEILILIVLVLVTTSSVK
jgi:hypothetical protein